VAASPADVSSARPFYPRRPGGAAVQHLLDGLGLASRFDLLRACDRSPPLDRPAAPLFWTLGAQQVGKGALTGWRELVRTGGVRVWPFDGPLGALLASGGTVVAETYPGQAARDLGAGFGPGESKRRRDDRRARGKLLLERAAGLGVRVARPLAAEVVDGFGQAGTGEDRFDAFVGLLQVVRVLRGERPPDPPPSEARARSVEGWMLGIG
jgi:hypothetical protein